MLKLIKQNKLTSVSRRLFSEFNIASKQKKGKSLYLDNAATSPLDFRVLDAMLPFMTNLFGNAHSRSHVFGWESEKAVEDARQKIANLIKADSKEIIFTSGATESNNLAIKGLAKFYGGKKS
jgi:cysteine desulfurase